MPLLKPERNSEIVDTGSATEEVINFVSSRIPLVFLIVSLSSFKIIVIQIPQVTITAETEIMLIKKTICVVSMIQV